MRTLSHSKIQEITREAFLDVQFNSQDVFGYMPLPKESWFRYMKSSKESWPSTLSAQYLTSTVALKQGSLCSQLSESSEFKVYGRLTGTKICDKPSVFPSNVKSCLYGWKVSASVYSKELMERTSVSYVSLTCDTTRKR